MAKDTGSVPPTPQSAEELRAQIAASLRAARARTGLNEQQVVDLLVKQGLEVTTETLEQWETSGLLHVDSAVHLATAYGMTIDLLAGRRAYRQRQPASDLPPAQRGSW
jgi:hypothetical protein